MLLHFLLLDYGCSDYFMLSYLMGNNRLLKSKSGNFSCWVPEFMIIVLPGICSLLWKDEEIWRGREDVPFRCAEVSFYAFQCCLEKNIFILISIKCLLRDGFVASLNCIIDYGFVASLNYILLIQKNALVAWLDLLQLVNQGCPLLDLNLISVKKKVH